MARKKKKKKYQVTRSLAAPAFIGLICLFTWTALLTFDIADWPNPSHAPHNDPTMNACGHAGSFLAFQLFYWIGDGSYILVLFATMASFLWLVHGKVVSLVQRTFGVTILIASVATSVSFISTGGYESLAIGDGGVLGAALAMLLRHAFSNVGTILVLAYSFLVGLTFAAEGWVLRFPAAVQYLKDASADAITAARTSLGSPAAVGAGRGSVDADDADESELPPESPKMRINSSRRALAKEAAEQSANVDETTVAESRKHKSKKKKSKRRQEVAAEPSEIDAVEEPAPSESAPPKLRVNMPRPMAEIVPDKAYPTPVGDWDFPPHHLLHDPELGFNAQQESIVRAKAKMLEQTLEEFRLDARVVEIETGPVITMFELAVGAGIKVSQIASLTNDIARALKAPAIRVVAPIPGKNTVGIEVPNANKEKVRIKELLALGAAKARKMALPIFFGKDASGAALMGDLAAMPHMLIAGTTGSGKSVCINSVIASFLMTKKPDEVKLILVDPKMVEMSQFKDVPHLMSPIITDMNRAEQILDWAVTKMEERYELLAEARVRNIASYNRLGEEEIYKRFSPSNDQEKSQIPVKLPYIVIVIDELADLMMTSAKEVEHHLARLAQKSRAVGVHIVVATQRPEAKVVTGLIKSNMPCRVAFRVASRMDSRIVLDQNGAEVLMGQGDMLFLPPGSHKLIRAQGTLLEDDELNSIIDYLVDQGKPEFHPQLMRIKAKGIGGNSADRDALFDKAVVIVLESQRGSVSLLQRRLSIGYSRASRLIDEMAEAGVVGEFKGSQAREVEMTLEEWQSLKARVDREVAEDNYAADADDVDEVVAPSKEPAIAQVPTPTAEVESAYDEENPEYDDDDDEDDDEDDDDDPDLETDDVGDDEEEDDDEEDEDDDDWEEDDSDDDDDVEDDDDEEYDDEDVEVDEEYDEDDEEEQYDDDEEEEEEDDDEDVK
ncbi:MAG: DNA translocase FtsK [Phycisphaerae bacterium]|nr:MAG: DNA translocase FtsK [Phycisphaerae bacterium]